MHGRVVTQRSCIGEPRWGGQQSPVHGEFRDSGARGLKSWLKARNKAGRWQEGPRGLGWDHSLHVDVSAGIEGEVGWISRSSKLEQVRPKSLILGERWG